MFFDNKVTIHIAANSLLHEHRKLINIDYNVVHKNIQANTIKTSYISTQNQVGKIKLLMFLQSH